MSRRKKSAFEDTPPPPPEDEDTPSPPEDEEYPPPPPPDEEYPSPPPADEYLPPPPDEEYPSPPPDQEYPSPPPDQEYPSPPPDQEYPSPPPDQKYPSLPEEEYPSPPDESDSTLSNRQDITPSPEQLQEMYTIKILESTQIQRIQELLKQLANGDRASWQKRYDTEKIIAQQSISPAQIQNANDSFDEFVRELEALISSSKKGEQKLARQNSMPPAPKTQFVDNEPMILHREEKRYISKLLDMGAIFAKSSPEYSREIMHYRTMYDQALKDAAGALEDFEVGMSNQQYQEFRDKLKTFVENIPI